MAKWFRAFFMLLVVLSVSSVQALELNVLSFNIRYGTARDGDNHWQKRKGLVFNVLKHQTADVVGLQEALKFQIDEILDQVPAYEMIGVGRDDGDTLGEYSAILYNKDKFDVQDSGTFWFSDTPDVVASKSWGNSITRICTWALLKEKTSSELVYHYNLHLDHRSQPSREKSTALLVNMLEKREPKAPFVVTGDFNAGEDNPAILFLTQKPEQPSAVLPLVDTFRILHPDAKEVGTFNGFKGKTTGDKIDFVFVPHGTKVLKAEIIRDNQNGRYPSDHFPVSALVEFKKADAQ